MKISDVQMEPGWKAVLAEEFARPYFGQLKQALLEERAAGKIIYPPGPLIFNAFNTTPFDVVKVVILGQDPYHQPGQAMGLSFSVPKGVRIPASLVNIYKELESDLGISRPMHGDLSSWARQGVFLLNAILTVPHGEAGAHQRLGWQVFTDAVIHTLSEKKDGLVFMLWGNFAKSKKALIDERRHLVLEAAHPSPLAGNKFAGCRHFSQANEYLKKQGLAPIHWDILAISNV
ncbi:MAG: uracil-DNA glycosylase [Chitinophagaceae bacterium]|nr:uracil-DNA glycosylase [Chitinophagaceae bacterium]